jgi:hypothetical protein
VVFVVFVGAKKCQGAKMYICSGRGDKGEVLPKLVQNACCIIEMRAISLIYIIIT